MSENNGSPTPALLTDESQVAILATHEDLQLFIEALSAYGGLGRNGGRRALQFAEDLRLLKQKAFKK